MKEKVDVVIVGAGLAGLATALDLLDSTIRIVILDRNGPQRLGGLAKESFGGIFFVGSPQQKRTGIKDHADLAFNDWMQFGEIEPSDVLARQWAETYVNSSIPKIYSWLRKKGVSFFPVVHWVERGLFRPGNSVPRFHMVWGTGYGLIDALVKQLKNHPNANNLEIRYHHRVDTILGNDRAVEGVSGVNEESAEPFEIWSSRIVIGTGGIGGSISEVRKNWFWPKVPETILNGTHPSADGTMHQATRKVGGQVVNLEKMWLYAAGVHHPRPDFEGHGLSLVPPKSALWVNATGKRLGPVPLVAGFDTRYMVEQTTQQEYSHTWQILNRKIANKELAVSGSEFNEAIRDKKLIGFLKNVLFGNPGLVADLTQNCQDFVVAGSLPELVDKMNRLTKKALVDLDLLQHEIDDYDNQIRRGKKFHNDDQLRRIAQLRSYRGDRVRTCNFQAINEAGAMPLMAIRLFPLSRKTLGGIRTDLNSRVLNQEGNAIGGLYAVGEAAGFGGGGIHGIRALEGTFLGSCILTGRHAAEAILEEI